MVTLSLPLCKVSSGLVDILFEPEQCRRKVQESHETSCEFVIASENASVPLDFVNETFDDVAFSVADSVIGAWLLTIAAERNHHLDLLSCEQLSQRVGIVAFIGNSLCRHPTIVAIVTERIRRQRTLDHEMGKTGCIQKDAAGRSCSVSAAAGSQGRPVSALQMRLSRPASEVSVVMLWVSNRIEHRVGAAFRRCSGKGR